MTIDEAIEATNKLNNRPTNNIYDPVSKETHTLEEWANITGKNINTIYNRIFRLGWHPDIAVTTGATNPEVYRYIPYGYDLVYIQNQGIPITMFKDILGNHYTQKEWEALKLFISTNCKARVVTTLASFNLFLFSGRYYNNEY